jgi:gag-polypeptide of LTR copia-type
MDKYLNSFRKAASELSSIGATMSDEDLTDMHLCSLPKSFDTLIQTQDNNKASFMITCNRLTAEVRRQKLRLNEETPAEISTAFYSRHDGNAAQGQQWGQGNRPRCNHCNRLGHDADRCWIKHPELRPNRLKRRKESEQGTAQSRRQRQIRTVIQPKSCFTLRSPTQNCLPSMPHPGSLILRRLRIVAIRAVTSQISSQYAIKQSRLGTTERFPLPVAAI